MPKIDLVRAIAENLDINRGQARVIGQKVLDTVRETVATEGRLELRNFGVFEVKGRAARNARNPRTGEQVFTPETCVVTFKPGKVLQQRIASGSGRK